MSDSCRINPHGSDHYWLVIDTWLVCMFCEQERPIRQVETVAVVGGYL